MRFVLLFFITTFLSAEVIEYLDAINSKVKKIVLDNGLRVLVLKRDNAPVFSGVIDVKVGGVNEPAGKSGIAHMLEHMAFKGTPSIGTSDYAKEKKLLEEYEELITTQTNPERIKEVQSELSKIWIPTEFDNIYRRRGAVEQNATTSKEITSYFVSFPKTAFEFWCWVESERLVNPVFRQFYSEKEVVKEERRMRFEDDPGGKLYEALLKTAFNVHPYKNPVIGTWDDLKKISAKETEEFHKQYYVASNMVVSIVGDISEKEIEILKQYFSKIPSGKVPEQTATVEPEQTKEKIVSLRESAEPQLLIGYKKPNYPDSDDPPISLLEQIMAGSSISTLYKKLVQEQEIIANINVYEEPGNLYPNLFIFELIPKFPATNKDVIDAFDKEVAKIRNGEITQEQLDIARRALSVGYLNRLDNNSTLAENIASSELIYGDYNYLTKWFKDLQAVTLKDVKRAAKQYLNPSTRTVAFLEKKK